MKATNPQREPAKPMKPTSRVRVIEGLEGGYPYPYPSQTRGHTRMGSPTLGEHYQRVIFLRPR